MATPRGIVATQPAVPINPTWPSSVAASRRHGRSKVRPARRSCIAQFRPRQRNTATHLAAPGLERIRTWPGRAWRECHEAEGSRTRATACKLARSVYCGQHRRTAASCGSLDLTFPAFECAMQCTVKCGEDCRADEMEYALALALAWIRWWGRSRAGELSLKTTL